MSDENTKEREEEETEDEDEDENEEESDDSEDDDDEEGDDELDTAGEFRSLYVEAKEAEERFSMLAVAAEKIGDGNTATIYREVAKGLCALLADAMATTGGAITQLEERVATGDDRESFLTEEDALDYLKHYRAVLKLIDDAIEAAPSHAIEQRDALAALKRATEERIEYTKELGDIADEKAERQDA